MKNINIENIDLGLLSEEVKSYENQWIAVSDGNKIVASALTYGEAVDQVRGREDVVLLKVPPFDATLAP